MIVIITGASCGMGEAAAIKFLSTGHEVYGLDILPESEKILEMFPNTYVHYRCNVADKDSLPDIAKCDILVNNAGVQGSGEDIDINLKGLMYCTEKYALHNENIKSVLNQAALSAYLGTEFGEHVASKGGVIAYTKWTAKEIAKYGATCNSLSFGGVITESNKPVIYNHKLWAQVMALTPLDKWCTVEEAAEFIYFFTVVNKSCSGQDIIIDNLESLNGTFVWE